MISLHLFIVQCSSSTKFAKLADVFCLACFCNDVKNKFLQLKIPSGINFRWFQEISIPTPWRLNGNNSKGVGMGSQQPNILKYEAKKA